MNKFQCSVVHRLPQSYRWLPGSAGIQVGPLPAALTDKNNKLLGLKLLGHPSADARKAMQELHHSLQKFGISSAVVEWEEEPCLFVPCSDESTVMGHLKGLGVLIAETEGARDPC